MQTLKLDTYDKFKKWDYPYRPRIANGKLLCPNFSVNANNALKNKVRLVITTVVAYNRGNFAAVYYASISKFGIQSGWCYFVAGFKVTWHELTWDQRRKVVRGFVNLPQIDYIRPPTAAFRKWAKNL